MSNTPISYVFFGTGTLAESVLASLMQNGYTPKIIVTRPDSPQGRHMIVAPPHIKVWANLKGIPVLQPESLDSKFSGRLMSNVCDLFIVASYGKIIPKNILNIPKFGALNVHPSLLPEYRGPSPIESALLGGKTTLGVTIIKLDEEIDHGPILIQSEFKIDTESTRGTIEITCGQIGGDLLSKILPDYASGDLKPKEQDHKKATFCKKITKELGEIKISDDADSVRNKFRALTPWPSLYFFIEHAGKKTRVKVTNIDLVTPISSNSKADEIILSVIPEGKKEIDFESFKRGYLEK